MESDLWEMSILGWKRSEKAPIWLPSFPLEEADRGGQITNKLSTESHVTQMYHPVAGYVFIKRSNMVHEMLMY